MAVTAASWASGSTSPMARPEEGQAALDDHQRDHAGRHPPAERRRERDRGEPVQGRLEVELVGAVPEAVVERAQDGQRTGAEDQRGDHEALDEPVPLGGAGLAGEPALQPATERLDARLEAQQRADDAADQQRAEHDQRGRAVADQVGQVVVDDGHRRRAAMSSVTSPRASVTRSRVRTGAGCPAAPRWCCRPGRRRRSRACRFRGTRGHSSVTV